jgi:all-trans-8'-apo-beta-carotenal 15,15'-oxygenase
MPQAFNSDRRTILQALAAIGLAGPLANAAQAATDRRAWSSSYEAYDGPFNQRFSGTLESAVLPVEGRLPASLSGTFYRNGPARMRLGRTAYSHWFDGDGMVQAFRFSNGTVGHRGVLLRTPKLVEEEIAGRFLYAAFGTPLPGARPVRNADTLNVANINLLPMNDGRDLYALWEAGSAVKIDPRTLHTQGFKVWSPGTAGAPFSAHPRIAPDGTVWNFGYLAGTGKLIIYEIGRNGQLRREALIDAPQADMVHDFAITERYLVFLLMPLTVGAAPEVGQPVLRRYRWDGHLPLLALLVDKRDFSVRRFELPNGGAFHIGNAWEEKGVVRLAYVRQPDILGAMRHMKVDRANPHERGEPPMWVEAELELGSGRARQNATGLKNVEFPRYDTRHTGQATDLTILTYRSAAMAETVQGFDSVLTLRNRSIDRHVYGAGWIAEEHIHVTQGGSAKEGTGWIIGTAYHWPSERTTLSVFDAEHLADGPVAQVRLPYGLPLGLHGQFVAK